MDEALAMMLVAETVSTSVWLVLMSVIMLDSTTVLVLVLPSDVLELESAGNLDKRLVTMLGQMLDLWEMSLEYLLVSQLDNWTVFS